MTADEEKPVERPDPPVKITFDGISAGGPRRKLVRIGGEKAESTDNIQITTGRTAKKERQIYIPPVVKKSGKCVARLCGDGSVSFGGCIIVKDVRPVSPGFVMMEVLPLPTVVSLHL